MPKNAFFNRATIAAWLMLSFTTSSYADTASVSIHGSNTIGAELMPALVESYATQNNLTVERNVANNEESVFIMTTATSDTRLTVDLKAHGSSTAFTGLQKNAADIGMASRPIKATEVDALARAGLGNMKASRQEHILALDGLTVIVHPNNPLHSISLRTLADVFSGKVTNWQQLGGTDTPITVYARDEKSGTFDTFQSLVLKPAGEKLTSNSQRFTSNEKLSDSVAQDKTAIGFTGLAYIRNAKALDLEGACGMRFTPSEFTVKTEEYPLARRLYLYTSELSADTPAGAIVEHAMSSSVQQVVTDAGFVNLSVALKAGQRAERLHASLFQPIEDLKLARQLSTQLKGALRTSVIFHFLPGSAALENKSLSDIERLSEFLSQPEHQDKSIYILGFTDARGAFRTNQRLSQQRAEVVAKALTDKGITPTSVNGYGELAPVDCNQGAGLDKNRRVEVWLK